MALTRLLRWTPGFGVTLEGATREDIAWSEFVPTDNGLSLPAGAFPGRRVSYLRWAVDYLDAVLAREPSFACLGLHEWAMVYRDPAVRHPYVPLRCRATKRTRWWIRSRCAARTTTRTASSRRPRCR